MSDGNNIFRDGGAVLGGVNSTSRFLRKIVSRLRNLNLVQQFALAGSIVVIIAMTVIGRWVAMQIEGGVVNSTSAATALYMDAILAPIVPDLINEGGQRTIPDERINHIMRQTEFGQRVVSIKIWKRDGHIIFSNRKELIGRQFVPSLHLKKAWSGVVSAEFDNLSDEEDTHERASGLPLLEMYMPVRQKSDGKIIAVAEFYILAHQLRADLARAYGRSWVLVGIVTFAMMGALFGIVRNGNQTIEMQRKSLRMQVDRLTTLLDENRKLSTNLLQAYRRAGLINEGFLRRVGADLHDGPAQLIGHALLRLDMLRPDGGNAGDKTQVLNLIEGSLKEALTEIRRQSAGLALPELDNATPLDAMELAIRRHERHTQTHVQRCLDVGNRSLTRELTVCVYRLIQEGLNNCFHHAGGAGQEVVACAEADFLTIEINDRGPGVRALPKIDASAGIGLISLRDRIEALGGEFSIGDRPGGGTRLAAKFSFDRMELADV